MDSRSIIPDDRVHIYACSASSASRRLNGLSAAFWRCGNAAKALKLEAIAALIPEPQIGMIAFSEECYA